MPVRMSILIRRLPHLTPEEFHTYWSTSHAPLFLSIPIVQRNLTKYSQYHLDSALASQLRQSGLPIAEYDGFAEFWAESYEDVLAVFQDEEYSRVVVPDEVKFLDREKAVMMVGWEEGKFEREVVGKGGDIFVEAAKAEA
ncbi:hypothetical protein BAUCODRAFT_147829 [Baudoinia panamericana UAMH 10762]|uniref:EthD domain-containing protein n=1 Tax=Baudoinia panamericana (strain UAMH 10762) TaxID=717646 RepID=M2MXA2_BAUPA|nr:uncharacterized protein BAUCODRAFT_147829 [Baudoinia panamericana UAMH 10762]EMC96183.1 hypothetical protein BAUCODRAFT_147829 [Baudoinia panamericana UAMH 10762]